MQFKKISEIMEKSKKVDTQIVSFICHGGRTVKSTHKELHICCAFLKHLLYVPCPHKGESVCEKQTLIHKGCNWVPSHVKTEGLTITQVL